MFIKWAAHYVRRAAVVGLVLYMGRPELAGPCLGLVLSLFGWSGWADSGRLISPAIGIRVRTVRDIAFVSAVHSTLPAGPVGLDRPRRPTAVIVARRRQIEADKAPFPWVGSGMEAAGGRNMRESHGHHARARVLLVFTSPCSVLPRVFIRTRLCLGLAIATRS